ncbi:MAG: GNAT family N-acetyltransferase [bacterium JZ-2024 1]
MMPRWRNLKVITKLTPAQVRELIQLYREAWWAKNRKPADIRRMLKYTDIIVGLQDRKSKRLVAAARVITDKTYKAMILDVIVAKDFRGRRLGTRLLRAIMAHKELKRVRHFELYCRRGLTPFYRRLGFDSLNRDLVLMRREKRPSR